MAKKLNITERLDFNDIDLTAPEKVIDEILTQLSEETKGIVGKVGAEKERPTDDTFGAYP